MSKTYTLNRCRPVPEGEWDNTKTYLELSVVYDPVTGDSYTSKIPVPTGALLTNVTYWTKTSDFNSQLVEKGNFYNTVAEMKADNSLTVGMTAYVKGYHSAGDGGEAFYQIVTGVYLNSPLYQQIGTSTKYAKLINKTVSFENFGAIGDGVTDDYNAIFGAINSGLKINLLPKIYGSSVFLTFDNIDNIEISGNFSTIKNIGSSTLVTPNDGFFTFQNCNNVKISDLIIDSDVDFVLRPVYGDEGVTKPIIDAWVAVMQTKIHGFKFKDSSNINVSNCVSINSRVGYFISGCVNSVFKNNKTYQSLADGIFIVGASRNILVDGHECELSQDDQFSAVGYDVDETLNPSNIIIVNCISKDCFGGVICFEGSTYCLADNCIGYNNRYAPVKLGNLVIGTDVAIGHHQVVNNCMVKSYHPEHTHYLSNPNLLDVVTGYDTKEPYEIHITNCKFYCESLTDVRLYVNQANKVYINSCYSDMGLYVLNCGDVFVLDNFINEMSCSVFTLIDKLTIKCNKFHNRYLFNGVSGRGLYLSDCSNCVMLSNDASTDSSNSTVKTFPIIFEVSTVNIDGLVANNPFQYSENNGKVLTNCEYLGIFRANGQNTPAYTVFKLGTLVSNSTGLLLVVTGAYYQVNHA